MAGSHGSISRSDRQAACLQCYAFSVMASVGARPARARAAHDLAPAFHFSLHQGAELLGPAELDIETGIDNGQVRTALIGSHRDLLQALRQSPGSQ